MGGQGSGRPPSAESILKKATQPVLTPIGTGIFIPNLSGEHDAGTVKKIPVNNFDIANKKYVDDSIAAIPPTVPGGSDTHVQYNDSGAFGGDAGLTYAQASNALTCAGTITCPMIIGGTEATSDLYFKTTTGVGVLGSDMHFLTSNNGSIEAMTITKSGYVGILNPSPSAPLHVLGNIRTPKNSKWDFWTSGPVSDAYAQGGSVGWIFNTYSATSGWNFTKGSPETSLFFIDVNGRVGIVNSSPTAFLHLPAGSATAGTAPLKFTSGALNTTPEAGVMEYDGTSFYLTEGTPTRNIIAMSPTLGISDTITTAALTPGGSQGSMTFVNGVLTAQTAAT